MPSHTTLCMYNNLPIRGWLAVPSSPPSPPNVIVLFHPSIGTSGTTPLDAAKTFLQIATDSSKLNLGSNILFACATHCTFCVFSPAPSTHIAFACAYPQDSIPGWSQQQASALFPGLDLSTLYIGDNIVYVSSRLLFAMPVVTVRR